MLLSRILGGLGRTLVTAGTLILLFVAYQLWGTNIHTARAQNALTDEFAEVLATVPSTTSTSTTSTSTTSTTVPGDPNQVDLVPTALAPADLPLPEYGDPIASISIPKIGVNDVMVVEGVGLDQLKRGPGHYQETPLPGQEGNAAIAGHRTTYGAPFHNVDKLENGDQITVRTMQGDFVYEVDSVVDGDHLIVKPDQVEVLEDKGDNRLTLTACHPKYSLRERIIISAVLVGQPAPPIVGQEEAREQAVEIVGETGSYERTEIDGDLSGESASKSPAIIWGLVCAGVWLATWAVSKLLDRRIGKRRKHRWMLTWSPYLVGVPVFFICLYVFFERFANLLPANY
ncbi:MAG: class E sortase [Acidimicrobiales bacterium]|nr:class E sortase [Acidimicrobiales bacterium]